MGQYITNPTGVTVFGSALVRVEPDIANLSFSVSSLSLIPPKAFSEVRAKSTKVSTFLSESAVQDVKTSRISLQSKTQWNQSKQIQVHIGYSASIAYNIIIRKLDELEAILSGIVDAGVININALSFASTNLKEYRAEARKRAILAAKTKAEIYCDAAGVSVGEVLHIDDFNPDSLRGNEGEVLNLSPEDQGKIGAVNPGSLIVKGAVWVSFAFATNK